MSKKDSNKNFKYYYDNFRIYVFPLIVLSVLTGLVIFVYVPTMQDIQSKDSKAKSVQADIDKLTKKLTILQKYTDNGNENLKKLLNLEARIEIAIPALPSISDTSNMIQSTAEKDGLAFFSLSTGQSSPTPTNSSSSSDSNSSSTKDTNTISSVKVSINPITGLEDDTYQFTFQGNQPALIKFLGDIYSNNRLLTISTLEVDKNVNIPNVADQSSNGIVNYPFAIDAYSLDIPAQGPLSVNTPITDPLTTSGINDIINQLNKQNIPANPIVPSGQ